MSEPVNIGIVGLGNVGMGALSILVENREHIAEKLGFALDVRRVSSRGVHSKALPGPAIPTPDWRDVVHDPEIHIVAELIGGLTSRAKWSTLPSPPENPWSPRIRS